jgi:phosphate transport system substrate-binding protein
MRKIAIVLTMMCLFFPLMMLGNQADGSEEVLRYSSSYQIYDALEKDMIEAFTKETGIRVDVYPSSSGSAVYRLMNDFSDIASTVRGLYYRHKESGYVEIAFCNDPLAIICNTANPVENITDLQVQNIFEKSITNWNELGGPDQPIIVIIPGKNTGAFKNFDKLAMKRKEIAYDYMSYHSTAIIDAVKSFPWSVSFISYGSAYDEENVKVLKVNNLNAVDKNYPYYQTFFYVTKGEPSGIVKQFIDFKRTDAGREIIKKKGMIPIP